MAHEKKRGRSRVASKTAPSAQNSSSGSNVVEIKSKTQYQPQGQGQGQGPDGGENYMCNPCPCCYGGDLRQACAAIAQVEIGFGVLFLILFIWALISLADGGSGVIVGTVIFILFFLVVPGIALLFGVIKRSKVGCLVHAAIAIIISILPFVWVIDLIYAIPAMESYKSGDKCKNLAKDDPLDFLCTGPGSVLLYQLFSAICLTLFLIVATLFAYFAANSIALYRHYKNDVTA